MLLSPHRAWQILLVCALSGGQLLAQANAQTIPLVLPSCSADDRPVSRQGDRVEARLHHRTVTANGCRLHYVEAGQGDVVLLLHGWPETWRAWRKVIPLLAKQFRVIAPDLPGLGESDAPTTGYDARAIADDVYQMARQIGVRRAYLVGHDIAAPIAYAYAAAHTEGVRGLVVLDGSIPGITPDSAFAFAPVQPTWQFNFHNIPDLPEALIAGKERLYLTWLYQHKAFRQDAISAAEVEEYISRYKAPERMRAGLAYYRAFFTTGRQNKEFAKSKLTLPVLALGGDHSTGLLMARMMQPVATDVRGVALADCGHYLAEEQPEALVQQLVTFFQRVSVVSPGIKERN